MSERRREIAILMIADVVVDVFTEETQSLEAEATSYPVEKGVDITDHIRVMPLRLSVSGVVSDFGLIDYEGEDTLIPSDYARARLEELFNDAGLITVATSRRTYENMAMVSLEISRDSDTGHALLFDAEFQQITTIENTRTIIRVKVPRQGKKKDLGPKATKKGDGKRMAPVDIVASTSVQSAPRSSGSTIVRAARPSSAAGAGIMRIALLESGTSTSVTRSRRPHARARYCLRVSPRRNASRSCR